MKKLLWPAFALALTACTPVPALKNASLILSPAALTLQRGQSREVSVTFVDNLNRTGEPYNLIGGHASSSGVRLTPLGRTTIERSGNQVRLKVEAAQNAILGKQSFALILMNKSGQLTQTLTVNVTP